jgi:hypothetical protein
MPSTASRAELAATERDRRAAAARHDDIEQRWHRKACAQQRRETNPDALDGMLQRCATRSSWQLRAVMAVGLIWSAVNVGRNLASRRRTRSTTRATVVRQYRIIAGVGQHDETECAHPASRSFFGPGDSSHCAPLRPARGSRAS